MPFVSFLEEGQELGALMARQPDRYAPFVAMTNHILTAPSELTEGERELIGAFVSALNACAYCTGTHTAIAKAYGLDPSLVDSVVHDLETAPLDPKMKAALVFSKKLTETPSKMVQADADAVTRAGWGDEALSDIIAVTALFAVANRLVDGHGIEGMSPSLNTMIGERVASEGYALPEAEAP